MATPIFGGEIACAYVMFLFYTQMVFVLEQLIQITSSPPQTPHERMFQDTFKDLIRESIEALKCPYEYLEPIEAIQKLTQLYQVCFFIFNYL